MQQGINAVNKGVFKAKLVGRRIYGDKNVDNNSIKISIESSLRPHDVAAKHEYKQPHEYHSLILPARTVLSLRRLLPFPSDRCFTSKS